MKEHISLKRILLLLLVIFISPTEVYTGSIHTTNKVTNTIKYNVGLKILGSYLNIDIKVLNNTFIEVAKKNGWGNIFNKENNRPFPKLVKKYLDTFSQGISNRIARYSPVEYTKTKTEIISWLDKGGAIMCIANENWDSRIGIDKIDYTFLIIGYNIKDNKYMLRVRDSNGDKIVLLDYFIRRAIYKKENYSAKNILIFLHKKNTTTKGRISRCNKFHRSIYFKINLKLIKYYYLKYHQMMVFLL